ncbi:tektin-2-like, partial [Polyodon spathula]|uniref:tektin-2-like n=1 Tax=Polyodon spathula TaxID=7913 RepID=UPI001B7E2A73
VKESTEKALAATSLPLDVAIECLMLREGRRGNDLVRDPVEAELHKEVEVIDRARKVLQQKVSQAFEQLCLLQEVRQQLTFDLRQKNEALDVDRSCLSLNVNSAGLSILWTYKSWFSEAASLNGCPLFVLGSGKLVSVLVLALTSLE